MTVEGDLTIRDTTKPITATGTLIGPSETHAGTRVALDVETTIKRQDFGVNWEAPALPGGGPSLADDVTLEFTLQLSEQDVAATAGCCRACAAASCLALRQQRLERGDELRPGLVGDDDVVEVPALGRAVRVREPRAVVVDELRAALVGAVVRGERRGGARCSPRPPGP